jgi:hypothetical protein
MDESIDIAAPFGLRVFPGAEAHLQGRNRDHGRVGSWGREEWALAQTQRRAENSRVEDELRAQIWTRLTGQVGICRSQEEGY